MSELPNWFWVGAAWLELALAYGGYLLYLARRRRRLERAGEERA